MNRRQFIQSTAVGVAVTSAASKPTTISAAEPESALVTQTAPAAIYLSDMAQCRPQSSLSQKWQKGRWRLMDYEADNVKGVMLVSAQTAVPPELTLPLNIKGWHAIYIGLRSKYGESRLQLRLKNDPTFSLITHHNLVEAGMNRRDIELGGTIFSTNRIDDLFWKAADLTSEHLVIRPFFINSAAVANRCYSAWLAYIKLVPLSDQQIHELETERKQNGHRRLFAHNDAFAFASWLRPSTEAEIKRELEPFRNTDFLRIYWEGGMGDLTMYPSQIGSMLTNEWMDMPYRVRDELVKETYQGFRNKGIDPFKVALDYAHELGLEFHASYRPAGFHFPAPEDEWNSHKNGLYDRHPEWRGVDRLGRSTPRLSFAYPGVRQFVISLLKEMASYPIDGVCILFNRRPPFIEYEKPVVAGFKAKYGQDPHKLDEKDPRWLSYRSGFLTQFMKEVREAMREKAREQGRKKPAEVTAVVLSSEEENLYYGLDLEAWVKQGLVDTIAPYTSVKGGSSDANSWTDPRDAEFFLRITKGSKCKLALNIMPRQIAPEEYRRRLHALYEAGVENFFFWDCYQRNDFSRSWSVLRRLGHRDEIRRWVRDGSAQIERPGSQLLKIGNWDLSYATPG